MLIVRFPNGRASGDAFALFDTEEDMECALKKDRRDMQGRYIELFRSSLKEFLLVRKVDSGQFVVHPTLGISLPSSLAKCYSLSLTTISLTFTSLNFSSITPLTVFSPSFLPCFHTLFHVLSYSVSCPFSSVPSLIDFFFILFLNILPVLLCRPLAGIEQIWLARTV